MRSQKQGNKAPRPFKNNSSQHGWSGGNSGGGFIPGSTSKFGAVKKSIAPKAAASVSSVDKSSETPPPVLPQK